MKCLYAFMHMGFYILVMFIVSVLSAKLGDELYLPDPEDLWLIGAIVFAGSLAGKENPND